MSEEECNHDGESYLDDLCIGCEVAENVRLKRELERAKKLLNQMYLWGTSHGINEIIPRLAEDVKAFLAKSGERGKLDPEDEEWMNASLGKPAPKAEETK